MKKETRLYQLMNSDGQYCGILETDALEGDIEAIWSRVEKFNITEEDRAGINHYGVYDNNYCDWVVAILQYRGCKASRVIATEIYS